MKAAKGPERTVLKPSDVPLILSQVPKSTKTSEKQRQILAGLTDAARTAVLERAIYPRVTAR